MPKVRISRIQLKKDLQIKITRYPESIKVETKYKDYTYVENRPFVYGPGDNIVGWNVRGIDQFWIPYISRIYANAIELKEGESKIIYVERR